MRFATTEDVTRALAGEGYLADHALSTAAYLLGALTELIVRDLAAAATLYRRAAEKGLRAGQLRWGLALLHGRGVDRDTAEAESWLRRAAQAGDPEAAALVGYLRAHGGERL